MAWPSSLVTPSCHEGQSISADRTWPAGAARLSGRLQQWEVAVTTVLSTDAVIDAWGDQRRCDDVPRVETPGLT
jgi:hypothetical protein